MLGSVLDFASVRGIKIDPATTCICCGCGEELPISNAYVDSMGRHCHYWCASCAGDERIASIYEIAIHELTCYLDRLDIPHKEPEELYDGFAVRFPWCEGDVACHSGTYGGCNGLMESYNFSMDDNDVTGYLHPLEALEIILHEWNERNSKMREGE